MYVNSDNVWWDKSGRAADDDKHPINKPDKVRKHVVKESPKKDEVRKCVCGSGCATNACGYCSGMGGF